MQQQTRLPALDVLRGVFLVLMTLTHLPTVWTWAFEQPFGFISAAEGFVFLSAFLVGRNIQKKAATSKPAAARWVMKRALKVYLLHMALLGIVFTLVAWAAVTFQRPAVRDLLSFYVADPGLAFLAGAALLYQPPLLDIYPMYVVFLLVSVPCFALARRWGWGAALAISALIWVGAQFGLKRAVYDAFSGLTPLAMPYDALGAFDLFAWQFLWMIGIWFGAVGASAAQRLIERRPRVSIAALVVVLALFVWRHWGGALGINSAPIHYPLLDKWRLAPVRILNLAAILLVFVSIKPQWAALVRIGPLERLGRDSLWAFTAHLVSLFPILLLLNNPSRPFGGVSGVLVLVVGFAALFSGPHLKAAWDRLKAGAQPRVASAQAGAVPIDGSSAPLEPAPDTVPSRRASSG